MLGTMHGPVEQLPGRPVFGPPFGHKSKKTHEIVIKSK